jgi:DNA-binding PadR family transcriptional regulator
MSRPIGYYWTARQSQIYPELARLAEDGLIASTGERGPGPYQRRTHRLTAEGRAALAEWLTRPPASHPHRDELVLKTYALGAADAAAMRQVYLAEADRHEAQVAEYHEQRAQLVGRGADEPRHPDFGAFATVELGITYEQDRARWCRWLAGELSRS